MDYAVNTLTNQVESAEQATRKGRYVCRSVAQRYYIGLGSSRKSALLIGQVSARHSAIILCQACTVSMEPGSHCRRGPCVVWNYG